MPRVVDVTLKLIDDFTKPLRSAVDEVKNSQRQLQNIAKSFQTVGNSISSMGSTLTAAVSVPIIGMGTAAMSEYNKIEQGAAKVSTLISKESGITMDNIKSAARSLSKSTGSSIDQITESMYQGLSAGSAYGEQLEKLVTSAAYLSRGGFADTSVAVDGMTTLYNAYGDMSGSYDMLADKMIMTQNLGKTTAAEISSYIGKVATNAASANIDQTDLLTTYALLTKNGIATAEATTYQNSAYKELTKSTSKVAEVLKSKTGKSFSQLMADGSDLSDVMKILLEYVNNDYDAFKELWSSQEAGTGMLVLARATAEEYDKMYNQIENSSGAAKDAYDAMTTPIQKLKDSINNIKISLGEFGDEIIVMILPYLEKFELLVGKITEKLSSMSSEEKQQIIKMLAIAATVGPVLMLLGKFITGIGNLIFAIQNISKAFSTLKNGIGLVSKFFGVLSLKMILIIAIIAAVALAVYFIIKYWDQIKEFFVNLWENVKIVFGQFVDWLKGFIAKAGEVVSGIKDKFLDIVNFVGQIFMARFQIILSAIKGYIQGWIDGIKNVIDGIKKIFQGIIDFVTGVFTGNWKQAWEGVKSIFGGIFQSLTGLVKAPFNAIIGLINGAISGINKINITVPDWVPGLGGKNFGFNIPTIPTLYTGTENWKGGTAIINEKAYGGEIVDLPSGSRVYPHDESINKAYNDGVNASFGGNSITIAKLADEIVVREDADIERIVNELARKLGDACASTGSAMAMSKMSNKVQSVNKAFAGV